jgi:hypothetical protein
MIASMQLGYINTEAEVLGVSLGCNYKLQQEGCLVIVVADKVIMSYGLDPDVVYRHEIGHCNGWGADHAGRFGHTALMRDVRAGHHGLGVPQSSGCAQYRSNRRSRERPTALVGFG